MSKITYDNKVDLNVDSTIANINKVSASDMNEIKTAVNNNDDSLGDISTLTTTDKTSVVNAVNELDTPEKWVAVGTTTPTDGRRVWFSKSKNVFDVIKSSMSGPGKASVSVSGTTVTLTTLVTTTNNDLFFMTRIDDKLLTNGKTYVISYTPVSGMNNTLKLQLRNHDGSNANKSQAQTVTYDSNYSLFVVGNPFASSNVTVNSGTQCSFKDVQVQEGSTATTYENFLNRSIYIDNELLYQQSTLLYQGSGSTTGTITLGDSVANYSCVDVVFCIDGFSENVRNYIRLEKYNSTQIFGNLISGQVDGSGNLRVWATRITISGTTATLDRDICLSLNTSGISSQTSRIKVVKVIGYK